MTYKLERQRACFDTGCTLPIAFRREQLRALQQAIQAHEGALLTALRDDLGKPALEAYTSEVGFVLSDIDYARRRLTRWMRPRRRPVPPIALPGRAVREPVPRGVALVIGPWNYPFQLLFSPLVGALAAGNCVCLKPSEFAPRTAQVVAELVAAAFEPELVRVETGDRAVAEALLADRFDTIFFTGSTAVGRLVMHAAARHLTPVILELGGKCPCIVCRDARLDVAARRILWGKCLNAGQTCVAPDHVLVDAAVKPAFLDALQAAHARFFPRSPRESPDFGRIVSAAHVERLGAYLGDGRIVLGGTVDAAARYVAPTVLDEVAPDAPVMQEEIFGPILPVLPFEDLDRMLDETRRRPTPLALYVFTQDRATADHVLARVPSGGACVNDTISHILPRDLPLGGLGPSGMGAYRGRATFDCFTHYRSVMRRPAGCDLALRYPPAALSLRALKRAYGFLVGR